MDWIVTTGETVEAALENALDELSVTADDVEYEVLQEPKKDPVWIPKYRSTNKNPCASGRSPS